MYIKDQLVSKISILVILSRGLTISLDGSNFMIYSSYNSNLTIVEETLIRKARSLQINLILQSQVTWCFLSDSLFFISRSIYSWSSIKEGSCIYIDNKGPGFSQAIHKDMHLSQNKYMLTGGNVDLIKSKSI